MVVVIVREIEDDVLLIDTDQKPFIELHKVVKKHTHLSTFSLDPFTFGTVVFRAWVDPFTQCCVLLFSVFEAFRVAGIPSYLLTPIFRSVERNIHLEIPARGHWRRTVWHALTQFAHIPDDVVATYICPHLQRKCRDVLDTQRALRSMTPKKTDYALVCAMASLTGFNLQMPWNASEFEYHGSEDLPPPIAACLAIATVYVASDGILCYHVLLSSF